MNGWLATLLVARNSYPLRIAMAVEVCPALADHLIGLVDVVQALKLKLGIQLRPVTLCFMCVPNYKPRVHLELMHVWHISLHFNR